MLVPRPPSLPPARRAVAEATVRYQQPAAISAGQVLPARTIAPDTITAPGDVEPSLHFSVVYELREYLAIMQEHLPAGVQAWQRAHAKTPRDRLSWSSRLALFILVPLMGTPIFLMKKRRMPVCRFSIDARGIERRTKRSTLRVAWSEVIAVHRYSRAYVIEKGNGGLPIPYRCLDGDERALLERMLPPRFAAG